VPDADRIGQLVDEYAYVDGELKAIQKRHKQLAEQIMAEAPADLKPEDSHTLSSARYTIEIKAREWQRRIADLRAVYKLLGIRKFLKAVSMTLKAFEEAVPEDQREALLVKERTGSRGISITRKFPA